MPKYIFIVFVALIYISFLEAQENQATEEQQSLSTVDPASEDSSKNELAREASSFSDFFRDQAKNAFRGVVYGNIIVAQDSYIYVKPKESGLGRMYIYLDTETSYSKMHNGKRALGKQKDLIDGQRVAVRVLMKEGIILADEIFLVEGDFGPRSRYRKKVSYKIKPKKDKESEKEAGGGHGSEKAEDAEGGEDKKKKEEKKSGGH